MLVSTFYHLVRFVPEFTLSLFPLPVGPRTHRPFVSNLCRYARLSENIVASPSIALNAKQRKNKHTHTHTEIAPPGPDPSLIHCTTHPNSELRSIDAHISLRHNRRRGGGGGERRYRFATDNFDSFPAPIEVPAYFGT